MIKPVTCACGNTRPEITPLPGGGVLIRCTRCGQAVTGADYRRAEEAWAEQISRWLDLRVEMDRKTGRD